LRIDGHASTLMDRTVEASELLRRFGNLTPSRSLDFCSLETAPPPITLRATTHGSRLIGGCLPDHLARPAPALELPRAHHANPRHDR
jgi:hypothetical protein